MFDCIGYCALIGGLLKRNRPTQFFKLNDGATWCYIGGTGLLEGGISLRRRCSPGDVCRERQFLLSLEPAFSCLQD